MTMNVTLDRTPVPIDREVFEALFEQSVVCERAAVRDALRDGTISYRKLIGLARDAEIPYPLFFAPLPVVQEQLRMKREKLMKGFNKKAEFAMNSRNRVHLPQVELIVKDLLRKQAYLRTDKSLSRNEVVGLLRKPGGSAANDAKRLLDKLELSPSDLRAAKNKTAALNILVAKLEAQHVLVAQSVKKYMPQTMPKNAKFSGMTVKDSKVPYIFIASGDEGEKVEPVGRRVFTVTLLAVLVARGRFATVNYSSYTPDEEMPREYEATAEILMPADDFRGADLSTLEAVREVSEVFKVTPSAIVMRGRRLGLLGRDDADSYLQELQVAYQNADHHPRNPMLQVNALKKYNGLECSRRMLNILDAGGISHGDFCRVMFFNTMRTKEQVNDFRAAVG
jgi:hypothetical protein